MRQLLELDDRSGRVDGAVAISQAEKLRNTLQHEKGLARLIGAGDRLIE
jgi:hypothetical protein